MKLKLVYFSIQGDQYRIINHLQVTTWPDCGVPDPPEILVRFVRAFRDRIPPEIDRVRPIVVHCSAGVGRSGTFIALDHSLQHIKKSDLVDVLGIVYNMRRERVTGFFWRCSTHSIPTSLSISHQFVFHFLSCRSVQVSMVQTRQQYICIYRCLLSVLEGKEDDILSPREITNDAVEGKLCIRS